MASVSDLQDLCLFKEGGLLGPCGQWQWTSGKLKRNGTIPWNVQCMPLDDKHFIHHTVCLCTCTFACTIILRCFCKQFCTACNKSRSVISSLPMA